MTMSKLQGSWIWYELMTGDPAGSKSFYEAVVGWRITLGTEPPMYYGMIANGDTGCDHTGGLMPLTPEMTAGGARAGWLGYIGVDDCDAAVSAVTAKGGKLLLPAFDVEHIGRIAMVADPDGAPYYVMTPKLPAGSDQDSTAFRPEILGRCAWNNLHAANQAGALDFYTSLYGWTLPEPMDMGEFGKYHFIDHDGGMIGAIMQKAPHVPTAGWGYYFRVADIEVAAQAAKSHGGQVFYGPVQVPGGDWIINGIDPQGATFGLVGAKTN
jgi:predicted enzyme related to lactoylglutathione lyase